MKPFNREKCMAGEPVVTRDRSPYKFGAYNPEALTDHQIIGWVAGRVMSHNKDGKFTSHGDTVFDLFMAPVKYTIWINIYPGAYVNGEYASKDDADKAAFKDRIACIKVEFEEGEGL